MINGETFVIDMFPGEGGSIQRLEMVWKENRNLKEGTKLVLNYLSLQTSKEVYTLILQTYLRLFKVENGIILSREANQTNITCLSLINKGQPSDNQDNYFQSLDSLYGAPFRTGNFLISNSSEKDPRSSKDRLCHAGLNNFMGIPFTDDNNQIIFMIGLANRDPEFEIKNLDKHKSFFQITNSILNHWHAQSVNTKNVIDDANTAKKSFLATVSHEVRTPLTSMLAMSVRLLQTSDNMTSKQKKQLQILNSSGLQLLELLNDILDYSRMKAHKLALEHKEFSLEEAITCSVDIIRHDAQQKNLQLNVSIDQHLPSILVGDKKRIKQIIVNLMKNACKFTEIGSIMLEVTGEPVVDTSKHSKTWKMSFMIRDTGIGIPAEFHAEIFEDFTQVQKDQIYNGSHNGTGLGLAICRELVTLMQGRIWVESDGVSGTTFFVEFSLEERPNLKELILENATLITGQQIMVVDDNVNNRSILTELLFDWGMIPLPFGSAQEGLDYLRRNRYIRVAIIDICMPQMSGLEMAQKVREYDPDIKMVGISSVGHDVQGKEWFDHYQLKPIDEYELFYNIVNSYKVLGTEKLRQPRPPSPRQVIKSPSDIHILIAEDDVGNRETIVDVLDGLGYNNVTCVSNGIECVKEIRKRKFDVCFMDIKMPGLNGLEATARLKYEKNRPMIVAVTASVDPCEKDKCMQTGMDGYLSKPYTCNELKSVLERLIV